MSVTQDAPHPFDAGATAKTLLSLPAELQTVRVLRALIEAQFAEQEAARAVRTAGALS